MVKVIRWTDEPALTDQLSDLIRGQRINPSTLDHLLAGLRQLITAFSAPNETALIARSQIRAMAANIAEILSEEVKCVAMNGRLTAQFRFGLAISRQRLVDLAAGVDSANARLQAIDALEIPSNLLADALSVLHQWSSSVVPAAIDQLIGAGMPNQVDVQPSQRLLDTLRDAQREQRLDQLEETITEATNEWGKERLATTFVGLAKDEDERAAHWNKLVMLFVVLGIAFPLAFIYVEFRSGHPPTTISILLRTLIGLPMFALATYSGRISAQHRRLSTHMRVLVAQLDSVKLYIVGLEESLRQQIIAALGQRAFGDPGVAEPKEGTVGIPPEDVVDILEKAAKAIKEIGK